ncbi:MAG: 16S rRNA methyltransferase [Archaeoglobaceae archaeon]
MDCFIFLESPLELVPKEIANHPAIVSDARRRRKKAVELLLDDSKHHSAMKTLEHREKRGRPDIVHQCLLLLLDSPLRSFDIYVHTIKNEIIRVSRDTRLPRNYNRFVGLMEDLFKRRKIEANGKVLIEILNVELPEIVGDGKVLLFSEKGERFEAKMLEKDVVICIGGFAHGEFFDETLRNLGRYKAVSLGKESYTSLYVTSRILCEYERIRSAEDSWGYLWK